MTLADPPPPEARRTSAEARADNEAAKAARAEAEARCRRDFLRKPDHEERCICSPPCSRDYDPRPYPEAEPWPTADYAGTGIGALYGGPMSAAHAAALAGWNITPGRYPE